MIRIGLDIDEVLADFINPYYKRFGYTEDSYKITKDVQRVLSKDRDFWLTLPKLRDINFEPTLYCSKRVNPKPWTKKWLKDNDFPDIPLYQMLYQKGNKANLVRGLVDVFIDDSISNFMAMNAVGVPCLLMDAPHNRHLGPMLRVYSLDINEIEEVYNLGLATNIFNEIK